jgi:outer membrane protein assembly factor BamB
MLWRIPFKTNYDQNIVTPVLYKDTLILAGLNNPTMGIRVVKKGAGYETEKIWENPQAPMYMSSPVLAGDLLLGFTHKSKGQVFGQDPKTGKVLWTSPGRQGDNAALEANGNLLFALKDDADLVVIRAIAGGFEPIRTYKVADGATYAHPVITGNGVFVKDAGSVVFWSWK